MTMNPNTRTSDLQTAANATPSGKTSRTTAGSLIAAAFILVVSFIANRFYQ